MDKSTKFAIKLAIIILATIFFVVIGLPVCCSYLNALNTPQPEIKYGEFPVKIVCEIKGSEVAFTDIFVCEYDGADWNINQGHIRKWKGYLKSNNEEDLVLIKDGDKKVICTVGSPKYYMGDGDPYIEWDGPRLLLADYSSQPTSYSILSEEMEEYYQIKLVSYEFSEPIVNTFKVK